MHDDRPAKFIIAKKLPADFSEDDSLSALWKLHKRLTDEFYLLESAVDSHQKSLEDLDTPERSYLDLKI
jgi:uncharacterized Fe-S radical SAM superfamily protein PflX